MGIFFRFVMVLCVILYNIKAYSAAEQPVVKSDDFDTLYYANENSRSRDGVTPSVIIAHCFGGKIEKVFDTLEKRKLSVHFIIPQITASELLKLMPDAFSGNVKYPNNVPVIQLVDTGKAAFHVGYSAFSDFNSIESCVNGLNNCSIGIEFHSPGFSDVKNPVTFGDFTPEQIETGIKLIQFLVQKYDIPPHNLLGHATVAVDRKFTGEMFDKIDPGYRFFWKELYDIGIGCQARKVETTGDYIYEDESELIKEIQLKLDSIGFRGSPEEGIPARSLITGDDFGKWNQLTIKAAKAFMWQFSPSLYDDKNPDFIDKELLLQSIDSLNCEIRTK